ncbi:Ankyrin and HET domain-containing protein [Colletotrichum tabaci]|uniref:Ankyrin and HET domain-containing protein n=1 Tax=Colletotrichum tabaci TaxID=1209068 RepID=A0AAV9TCP9_9PEZI
MIIVNRQTLKVTRSLATALRYLRSQDQGVILWADSICIDQSNAAEKNVQVALMGDIYRTAECVRIWLGEDDQDTAQAMQLVNDCNGFRDTNAVVKRVVGDERGAIGLAGLLRRPYWNRMWMFQEILLSKIGHVHCGTSSAPFGTFVQMDLVSSQPQLWPARRTSPAWIHDLRKAFFNIAQFTIAPRELQNLEHILAVTRVLQASEPADKLFALMGTCDMASYLTVDYDKTFQDIYVGFTRNYSKSTGKLSLTLTAGWRNPVCKEDDGQLPSWTPDYRGSRPESDIYAGFATAGVFNASKGCCFENDVFNPELPEGVLVTQGYILDTIQSVTPLLGGDDGRRQILETFDIRRPNDNPSGRSRLQALCETLIFDADGVKDDDCEETRARKRDRQLKHLLGFMYDVDVQGDNSNTEQINSPINWDSVLGRSGTGLRHALRSYKQLQHSDPATLAGYRNMFVGEYDANAGKISSVFVTRDNRFGRSNYTIRPGDVVAVLYGSDLPVILRKSGSCYKFLGGAYVSGMI